MYIEAEKWHSKKYLGVQEGSKRVNPLESEE
jgi:hypothetical protein